MPRVRLVALVVTAVAFWGSIVSAASVPQSAPTPQQPTVAWEVFLVDATTGALVPLEAVKTKIQGGLRSWYTYLPGAASSVVAQYGDPLVLATCSLSIPALRFKTPPYQLEQLAVKDGKRYATKQFIPLDVKSYGEPIAGLDPVKQRNSLAQVYLYTPRQTLPPGEYAVTLLGISSSEAQLSTQKRDGGAFRIVEIPRTSQPMAAPSPQSPIAPTNSAADIERLRKAAEQGDVAAQMSLAQAYAKGNGIPQDYQQTNQWLRRAADQGSAEAQYWLAVMYRDAVGVAPDQAQAAELFRKAAEQGHAQAQGNLGNLHFFGRGVVQDYVEAHKWLNIAGTRLVGDERRQCVELRDKVAGLMTPAQLADAQKRAREWTEAFERRRP